MISEIDNGDNGGDLVRVAENIVNDPNIPLKARNLLETKIFYGTPGTKTINPPKIPVSAYIFESSPTVKVDGKKFDSKSLMHRSKIVPLIEEPALAGIPAGHIIAMSSIDIRTKNQKVKLQNLRLEKVVL